MTNKELLLNNKTITTVLDEEDVYSYLIKTHLDKGDCRYDIYLSHYVNPTEGWNEYHLCIEKNSLDGLSSLTIYDETFDCDDYKDDVSKLLVPLLD